jgi:hypothetical protein
MLELESAFLKAEFLLPVVITKASAKNDSDSRGFKCR